MDDLLLIKNSLFNIGLILKFVGGQGMCFKILIHLYSIRYELASTIAFSLWTA